MPFDLTDAYVEITRLREEQAAIVELLKEKGIIEEPKETKKKK